MSKPQTKANVGRMWASSTQEWSSTLVPVPQGEVGPCLGVPRSDQRGPSDWHPGVGVPPASQTPPWISSFPCTPTGLKAWPNPPMPCSSLSGPTPPPPHTQTETFITKSFFIEGWVRDRNRECTGGHTPIGRGVRCWLTPCLLGHWKVRPGPQTMAVALEARLEWSWGCHILVLAAWPGCSFPQTATRGQPAPSAEEFSVAQVMAS